MGFSRWTFKIRISPITQILAIARIGMEPVPLLVPLAKEIRQTVLVTSLTRITISALRPTTLLHTLAVSDVQILSAHFLVCPALDPSYCRTIAAPTTTVITLVPGQTITIQEGSVYYINYFTFNPYCDAYIFRLKSDSSEPRIRHYFNAANLTGTTLQSPDPRIVMTCPGDAFWGKTVTISILSDDCCKKSKTTLSLETKKLPPARNRPPCPVPTEYTASHICINSGQNYKFNNILQKTFFRFIVPLDNLCGRIFLS